MRGASIGSVFEKMRDREWRANSITYVAMACGAVLLVVGIWAQETGRWDVEEHRKPDRTPVDYETEWGR